MLSTKFTTFLALSTVDVAVPRDRPKWLEEPDLSRHWLIFEPELYVKLVRSVASNQIPHPVMEVGTNDALITVVVGAMVVVEP